jgi:opacity protein-like surface antigen
MRRILLWTLAAALLISPAGADEPVRKHALEAVEFVGGFGWGDLDRQDDYSLWPFMVGFDFPLKPLASRLNLHPASLLQFQIEPFFAVVSSPSSNIETGSTFYIKTGFVPEDWAVQPYLKVGAGFAYMTLHTYEQGSQLNFIEQGAFGFHFFLNPELALNLEYRARHLSNADSISPNKGINTFYWTGGVTYKF